MAGGEAATSLAPGFRFHPTDEELVRYYLKRKVTNKPFRLDPISFVDIYKSEPWDLPGKAKLKSRDLEWYFFSVLDKKYGNGSKTNRATEKGYWKTTGNDRLVRWNSRTVGMKKTLVYHLGRAPRGERTNWVMHEYRLTDEELEKAGVAQDAFVLCRIFQKSGSGPKNGEQYGAPFVEEEWDNDYEVAALPFAELLANEVVVQDDTYVETNNLDQNYDVQATLENAVVPPNFNYGSSSYYVEHSADSIGTDLKPDGLVPQNVPNPSDGQNLLGILDQQAMDSKSVIDACGAQSRHNINGAGFNHYFDPYLVAADDRQVEDLYEQNNDVFNSGEPDSLVDPAGFDVVEEYLNFFDVKDENLTFDPSELIRNEDTALDKVPVPNKQDDNEVNEVASVSSPIQTEMDINNNASSSKKKPEPVEYEPDMKNPYMKQASYLLGDILAPPAFASEFPVKGAALQLNAGQSSTSVHVTAGVIRTEITVLGSNSMDLPFGKGREVDVVFSFGLSISSPTRTSLVPTGSLFSGKARSSVPPSWPFLLFWTLVLSVSYKIRVSVCGK